MPKSTSFICPKCYAISSVMRGPKLRCPACGASTKLNDYAKKMEIGLTYVRYGVFYRETLEEDYSKHGKITCSYKLVDPSEVFQFIGLAIAAGASYDIFKLVCKALWKQVKKSHSTASPAQKSIISDWDRDRLFDLVGRDERYAKKFFKYVKEYPKGMPTASMPVRKALIAETVIDNVIDSRHAGQVESNQVYITANGKSYHTKDCRYSGKNSRCVSLAKLPPIYKPCSFCAVT